MQSPKMTFVKEYDINRFVEISGILDEAISTLESNIKRDDLDIPIRFLKQLTSEEVEEELLSCKDQWKLNDEEIMRVIGRAHVELGSLYERGRYLTRDLARAKEHYIKAFDRGGIFAATNLGYLSENEKDYEKAFYYFSYAAVLGETNSLMKMGDFFAQGVNVPKNERRAFDLYVKAANSCQNPRESTFAQVQKRLGDCYRLGVGTPISKSSARLHYHNALVGVEACSNAIYFTFMNPRHVHNPKEFPWKEEVAGILKKWAEEE